MKIDIVIPTCGTDLADLAMTLSSCEKDLQSSGFDYRYFLVGNGNVTPEHRQAFNLSVEWAKGTGHLVEAFDIPQALSPHGARDVGAAAGNGEIILFADDHCKFYPDFFKGIISTFESTDAASVRGTIYPTSWAPQAVYHHLFNFDRSPFLGHWVTNRFGSIVTEWLVDLVASHNKNSPYRIIASAHGAFAIRRAAWEDIGGYWTGLRGFWFEEIYLDLKLALLDHKIFLNPAVQHWHQMKSAKPYGREFTQENIENLLSVANVIGGEKWARKVLDCFYRETGYCIDHLLTPALAHSAEHKAWLDSRRKRTFDQQLDLFRKEQVATLIGDGIAEPVKLAA